jgi:hypothetical protein
MKYEIMEERKIMKNRKVNFALLYEMKAGRGAEV